MPLIGKPGFGTIEHWFLAPVVIFVSVGIKFFVKGFASSAAVLIGLVAGYIVGITTGIVDFGRIGGAAWSHPPA